MAILNDKIEQYLNHMRPAADPVLNEMYDYGVKKDFPVVGPLVGRLLMQLALSIKAKRIFELGSGFGYSAAWFAKALDGEGEIFCTDISAKNRELAEWYFKKMELKTPVNFIVGDALNSLDETPGDFDIILLDIDKEFYPDAFKKVLPRIKRGGLLIADNVLWSGKIIEPEPEETTKAVLEFNRLIFSTNELLTTITPIRDGVAVCLKL